jgi:deazaflavin-dependent oxidoreductase (nitroreductase family)
MTTAEHRQERALAARRAFLGPLTRVLNPVIRRMAGRAGVPLIGLVGHRGRRSGRMYSAPVAIGTTETVFLIPLTFGPRSDWCRNILASGECEVKLHGVEYFAQDAEVVDDFSARSEIHAAFNTFQRFFLTAQGIHQFLRLRKRGRKAPTLRAQRLPVRGNVLHRSES